MGQQNHKNKLIINNNVRNQLFQNGATKNDRYLRNLIILKNLSSDNGATKNDLINLLILKNLSSDNLISFTILFTH